MSKMRIVTLYITFAIIATIANLATQRMSLGSYDGAYSLFAAIILGTGVGLVIKYVLDKYFIFQDHRGRWQDHSQQFSLYALAGVATTMIFWGTEYAFYLIWQTSHMRELGAIIGLAIGYTIKYQLDDRYVFESNRHERAQNGKG